MRSLAYILHNHQYRAGVFVFASLNILVSTWALYIPFIKDKLGIDNGQLGIALFCVSLGTLVSIPLVPRLARAFGIGKITRFSVLCYSLLFLIPFFVNNYVNLCVSLFVLGIFLGLTDVSMNALMAHFENRDQVLIMSAAHGFFSLGGVIGASIGTFFFLPNIQMSYHVMAISSCVFLLNLFFSKSYLNEVSIQDERPQRFIRTFHSKIIVLVALIAFVVMCCEGSIEHWSNLYLVEIIHIPFEKAGWGFIAFSLFMTIGRFFGDQISRDIGSASVIALGLSVAIVGYISIITGQLYAVVIGMSILGLGFSVVVPELFRLSTKQKNIQPTEAIAFVSIIGFMGFLLGPVLIGLISKYYNLQVAFTFLMVLVVAALAIILWIKRQTH